MTSSAMHESRFARLLKAMEQADLEAVALVPGANFYFLTGASFHLMERPTVLVVTARGDMHAVIPALERTVWQKLVPGAETVYWQDADGYEAAFASVASRLSPSRIGVEGQRMRVFENLALQRAFASSTIIDAHAPISSMRLCKDEDELAAMRKAVEISEGALGDMAARIRVGMSETEARGILMTAMLERGAEGFAFDPIVLAGGASSDPHGLPNSDRRLASGDPLLIDFGASWGGYHADITRTFFVGQPSTRHRDIYQAVLGANRLGRELAAPGRSLHDLDSAVGASLAEAGFAELIVHKTGHGLGLEVHEGPQVMVGNPQAMEEGMVVTIEPGLYEAGEIGVRIEDDVVVAAGGGLSLSSFERELTILGE